MDMDMNLNASNKLLELLNIYLLLACLDLCGDCYDFVMPYFLLKIL